MDEKGKIISYPDIEKMRNDLYAVSVTDATTKNTIEEVYKQSGIILEPHGAAAWNGLATYLKESGLPEYPDRFLVSLETAHPSKFPEEIREIIGIEPELSPSLAGLEEKHERFTVMENDYMNFRELLKIDR